MPRKLKELKRCKVCGKKRVPPAGTTKSVYYAHWREDGFCSRFCCEQWYAEERDDDEAAA